MLPRTQTTCGRSVAFFALRGDGLLELAQLSVPVSSIVLHVVLFLKAGIDGGTFGVAGPKELCNGSLLVALVQLQNNLAAHGVSGQRRMHSADGQAE